MTRRVALVLVSCLALLPAPPGASARASASSGALGAVTLEPVSPGAPDAPLVERAACPTFSWAASQPAESFRIRVVRVPQDGGELSPDVLSESLDVALDVSVPGGARSWTPSSGSCLERGGSYVWFVQSELDEQAVDVSPGYFFSLPKTPSPVEVEWARDVLSRHLGSFSESSERSESSEALSGARPPNTLARSGFLPTSPAGSSFAPNRRTVAPLASDNVSLSIDGILEARGIRAVASDSADGDIETEGDILLRNSFAESPGQIITATTFGTNGDRDDLVRLSSPEEGTVLVTRPGGSARAGELQLQHLHARSEVRADGGIKLSGSALTGSDGGTGVSYVPTSVDLINCSAIGRRCVPMDEAEALCRAGGLVVGVRFWETDTNQVGIQVWCTHP